MKTEKQLLIEAYQVQDACNLSGVVHSFSRAMTNLRELFPDEGTTFFNSHPVCLMYSDKIRHLTDSSDSVLLSDAFSKGRQAETEKE